MIDTREKLVSYYFYENNIYNRGRQLMTNVSLNWTSCNLFFMPPDIELKQAIEESYVIYNKNPQIEKFIEKDQHHYALEQKRKREADKQYLLDETQNMNLEHSGEKREMTLDNRGNKRMPTFIVYLFLFLRGYWGSLTDKESQERLHDSQTISILFSSWNRPLPSRTSILENLNLISNKTRDAILDAQLQHILDIKLDSFSELYVDSTAIEANSTFPSDSGTLYAVLERCYHYSQKLDLFGLNNFEAGKIPQWLKQMKKDHFVISVADGKNSTKRRKSCYKSFLRAAQKVHDRLIPQWIKLNNHLGDIDILPSKKEKLNDICRLMNSDLGEALDLIYYAHERVFNGVTFPASIKILSISDWAAAYIRKGNREDVFGFKIQLGRSAHGFVTSLILPQGNASDSKFPEDLVLDQYNRTGIIPSLFCADDGYTSDRALKELSDLGVEHTVFSGSKGKALVGQESWESEWYVKARNNRSCVESIIFTLKDQFDFGRVRRRGQDEVQAELTEKVLAYNLIRILRVKVVREKEREKELYRQMVKKAA